MAGLAVFLTKRFAPEGNLPALKRADGENSSAHD